MIKPAQCVPKMLHVQAFTSTFNPFCKFGGLILKEPYRMHVLKNKG